MELMPVAGLVLPFVLATLIASYLEFVVKRSRVRMQLAAGVSAAVVVALVSIFLPSVYLTFIGIGLTTVRIALTLLTTTLVIAIANSERVPRGVRVALAGIIGGVPLLLGVFVYA